MFSELNKGGRTSSSSRMRTTSPRTPTCGASPRRSDHRRPPPGCGAGAPPMVGAVTGEDRVFSRGCPREGSRHPANRLAGDNANILRSSLTVLGVMIGVAAVIILLAVGTGSSARSRVGSTRSARTRSQCWAPGGLAVAHRPRDTVANREPHDASSRQSRARARRPMWRPFLRS